jgi:hypothetical protein
MTRLIISLTLIFFVSLSAGCGYTSTSMLPPELNSIHVDNFVNKINPAAEVSDKRPSYSYWPDLENQLTRAVIDGFIFDRHLEIESEKDAALLLSGELMSFRQFPLSYDDNQNVIELRIEILMNLELYDERTGKIMWTEKSFMGWSSYNLSGQTAKSEAEGVKLAVNDIAQRIVERVVENW